MKKVILSFLILAGASVSKADYVKLYVGAVNFIGDVDSLQDIPSESDPVTPLALSYGFLTAGNWAIEAEFTRYANESVFGGVVIAEAEAMTLGFNGIYNYKVMDKLGLHGGAGIHFATYDEKLSDDQQTGLVLQLLTGVSYDVMEKLSVGVEFRFLNAMLSDLADGDGGYDNFMSTGVYASYQL